ncbi:hypothetical protein FNV43_RR21267 [Rhamnella rubrinervis]|uniref:Sacsin n=1 Tax=Rhamnella rubrinervis TaxID=2594499 RepID=A0A8K0GXM7_9ROSA|nr:hypothetical protein FNV43_RR21267 [Rhamnella rubrinervis]
MKSTSVFIFTRIDHFHGVQRSKSVVAQSTVRFETLRDELSVSKEKCQGGVLCNDTFAVIMQSGIGFKSVFLITARPYIFSNGYQIRFNEGPCSYCGLGYIVPEWVDENPSLSDIKQIYGSNTALPTTVLVLPLKPDKVNPVKQQLSSIHPEVLLFLSKIKWLSVREDNDDPRLNTVNAISILSETNFVQRKDYDAESYTLHLSAEEGTESERECSYYMWKQKFPVRQEFKVEIRMEADELEITLAFPMGDRPHRGMHSPVKSKGDAPISSLPHMFRFLPVNSSAYPVLNAVRESIKAKLVEENIVPSEPLTEQKLFHKPREVGRLMPEFWSILNKAREQGVSLLKLSSHGKYILSYSFDKEEYDYILGFLGVEPVDDEWYAKCIQSSNLVHGVSENVYLELLKYIADNWTSKFLSTNMKNIPLLKYVDQDEKVSMYSINGSTRWNGDKLVYLSSDSHQISWLIEWNREFRSVTNFSFMPESTQEALRLCSKKEALLKWLARHAGVGVVNQVNELGDTMPLVDSYGYVIKQRKGVLVPANGSKWTGLIVSNLWKENGYIELGEDYVRPGYFAGKYTFGSHIVDFLRAHAGASDVPYISPPNARIPAVSASLTKQNAFLLLDWIRYLKGRPVPEKFLTCIKEGSWLKVTLNGCPSCKPPSQSFMHTSSWGNILQNGSVRVDIPLIDHSYYGDGINDYKEELKTIGVMFEYGEACEFIGKRLMHLAASSTLTKSEYYGEEILCFKTELQLLGVVVAFSENHQLVINYLKPPSSLTYLANEAFLLILECMHLSNSSEKLVKALQGTKCLKTNVGYKSPSESLLSHTEWGGLLQVFNGLPLIDRNFYGNRIYSYTTELKRMGVVVEFEEAAKVFARSFRNMLRKLPLEEKIQLKDTPHKFPTDLKKCILEEKWLRTRLGDYRSPRDCILFGPDWESISSITLLPFIDDSDKYYGKKIHEFKKELKRMGAVVEFKDGAQFVVNGLYLPQDPSCITAASALSFLECIRTLLSEKTNSFPDAFMKSPCFEDYFQLWKAWESSGRMLSHAECCNFWGFVSRHWSSKTEKTLADGLVKVPVSSGRDGILLSNKKDVFIADDLQLKDLFQQFSPHPIFVWYPQPSLPRLSRTKLLEMFQKIGVRTISESVQKEEISTLKGNDQSEKDWSSLYWVFLRALPSKWKQKGGKSCQGLLNLTITETVEPVTVSYNLSLSSVESINVRASRMIRWDRESSKLLSMKMDRSKGHKYIIEFATCFSEVISEGLLWDNGDHMYELTELIKLAFVLEFNEEAVAFLMKSKNLEIFMEDEEFLTSVFPSV